MEMCLRASWEFGGSDLGSLDKDKPGVKNN